MKQKEKQGQIPSSFDYIQFTPFYDTYKINYFGI